MKTLLLPLLMLLSLGMQAQEHENKELNHVVVFAFGYTFIPKGTTTNGTEASGVFVPSVGFDYFHKISDKIEVGAMMDLELEDYLIFEKDLNREKAFIIMAAGAYRLIPNINLLAGAGIELEKHENLAVFRAGVEYTIKLSHTWALGTGFYYDIKKGYDTWSLSVGVGKEF